MTPALLLLACLPCATPADAAPLPSASPQPMHVPAALLARSRFEPSAAVWLATWQRFLVVSDDTGQQDGANEHHPWLFTVDARGNVDPEPVAVEGLDELTDLESMALAPDGAIYVLSAQNLSKAGKRPEKRSLLVRLRPVVGRKLVVTGQVDFTGALLAAATGDRKSDDGRAWFEGLGLRADDARWPPKRTGFALNIEAMALHEGALLLGLKAPQDADGRALLWRLAHVDRLLTTGTLQRENLSLWQRVPFSVVADGKPGPGGFADLLPLGDGSFLATATAPGRPTTQDGTLWRYHPREPPTLLRTFAGLKPEVLALMPDGKTVMVMFDRDQQTPYFFITSF